MSQALSPTETYGSTAKPNPFPSSQFPGSQSPSRPSQASRRPPAPSSRSLPLCLTAFSNLQLSQVTHKHKLRLWAALILMPLCICVHLYSRGVLYIFVICGLLSVLACVLLFFFLTSNYIFVEHAILLCNEKPDGDPKPTRNPMGAGVRFHPRVRPRAGLVTFRGCGRGRVFAPPNPNPTRCHP
jgi:hypothetical protein